MDSEKAFEQYKQLLFSVGDNITPFQKLILYLHASNLASGLKCTGKNEDDPESDFFIPPNWNKSEDDVYSMRYKNLKNNETIYFKFIQEENQLIANAVKSLKTGHIYSASFNINDIKEFDKDSLDKIRMKYKKNILNEIISEAPKKEDIKQTPEQIFRGSQTNVPNIPNPLWRPSQNPPNISPVNPFGDYGSSDLRPVPGDLRPVPIDPFGEMPTGKGNLLGPNNPVFIYGPQSGGMGLIKPPGARFDPYGPDDITPFPDEKSKNKPPPTGFRSGLNPFEGSGESFGGNFGDVKNPSDHK